MASGKTFFERNDEKIARLEAQRKCAEPGPWGTVCTQELGHRYSHYDAQDDSSWQDDWPDWAPNEDDN